MTTTTTNTDPNVDLINRMTAAILGQDHDALARVFADDFVFHLRGPYSEAGDHQGLGGLLRVMGGFMEVCDGQIDLEQRFLIGSGGWAAEWEHATLHRKGRTLHSDNSFVYWIEDGRIVDMWMFLGGDPAEAEAFFS